MAHMGGTASAEIEAPIEQVWAVVEDVLSAPEWQARPGELKARVEGDR